jgi:four helix bundle protein
MKENVILSKSYLFALNIIRFYRFLIETDKNYVVAKQLLRCGTSVGANIEEATGGQSRNDFLCKLTIAYKEARETRFWLRLLRDSGIADQPKITVLISDIEEILRILGSIQKTMRHPRNS